MNSLITVKYKNKKDPIYHDLIEDIKNTRSTAQLNGMLSSSYTDNILRNLYLSAYDNLFNAYISSCKEMVELNLLSINNEEMDLRDNYIKTLNEERIWLFNHLSNTVWFKDKQYLDRYNEDFIDRESRAMGCLAEFIGEGKAKELIKTNNHNIQMPTNTTIIHGDVINANKIVKDSPVTINEIENVPFYKKFIFKVLVGVTVAGILFIASLYKSDFINTFLPGKAENINNIQSKTLNKISILTDEQKKLLRLLNKYRIKLNSDILIVSKDGFIGIEKGNQIQQTGNNLIMELFKIESTNQNYQEYFKNVLYNIPDDYIRFIPETRLDSPYVVQLTEQGKNIN